MMQTNDTLKFKEIHVQQDFFDEIINGFSNFGQQNVDYTKAKMPSIMPMKQAMFFKKSSLPIILQVFKKNSFMDNLVIFLDQQRRKQNQGGQLQDYLKKWGLIRSIKKQQEQQLLIQQDFEDDQPSRKNILSTLVKAGKAYRKVKNTIETIRKAVAVWKWIRSAMQSQLGRTDFSNQYERESAFSDILQSVSNKQGDVVLALQKSIATVYDELRHKFYEKLSVGWVRFLGWLAQLILLPDTDSVIDMVAWGLSVAGGIFSAGSAFLGGALLRVGGTIGKIIVKFASIASKLFKFKSTFSKSMKVASALGTAAKWTNRARTVLVVGNGLLGLGKALYTGIDLYNTDEDDVKQMEEFYTKKSLEWQKKAQKAIGKKIIKPLQKIQGDLGFVRDMLGQAKNDLQRTISTLGGGGGAFKFFQKSNKTQVKIKEIITNKPKQMQKDISMSRMEKTLTALAKYIGEISQSFIQNITSIEVKEKYATDYEKEIGEREVKKTLNPLVEKYLKPFELKNDTTGKIQYSENYNSNTDRTIDGKKEFGGKQYNPNTDMMTTVGDTYGNIRWIYQSGHLSRCRIRLHGAGSQFSYYRYFYPNIDAVKKRVEIKNGNMDVITATDSQDVTKQQAKLIATQKSIYESQKQTKRICQEILKKLEIKFGKTKSKKDEPKKDKK